MANEITLNQAKGAITQYTNASKGKKSAQNKTFERRETKDGWTNTTTETFRGADGTRYDKVNVKDSKGGNKTYISFTTKDNHPVSLIDNDSDGKYDSVKVAPRPQDATTNLKISVFTSSKDNGQYDKKSTETINLLTGYRTTEK